MSKVMKYKGYQGRVEYFSDSGVYYGQTLEISVVVQYVKKTLVG
jgi:hypothetical protein